MENFVNRFYDAFCKNGWTIARRNICPWSVPECIRDRYSDMPMVWVAFLNSISVCSSPDETAWFLRIDDFIRQGDDIFRWNEFELMSLQAAIEDTDAAWQSSIVRFWDNHLPIYLSAAGGYEYYAIRMSDGFAVHGAGPEFEETAVAAPSFAQFIEAICTGERVL